MQPMVKFLLTLATGEGWDFPIRDCTDAFLRADETVHVRPLPEADVSRDEDGAWSPLFPDSVAKRRSMEQLKDDPCFHVNEDRVKSWISSCLG